MPNSVGSPALPPLSPPGDNFDPKSSVAVGLAAVGLRNLRNGAEAEDPQALSPTALHAAAAHAELISAALALAAPVAQTARPVKHPQAGGASTYTLQYIGVSNGELGILSQKQKLAPPKPPGGVGAAPTTAATSRAMSAAHRSRSSNALSAAGSGSAAGSRPASSASPSPPPIRSTYNPTLPPHSPRQALSIVAAAASASGDEAAGFAPSPSTAAAVAAATAAAPGRQQPGGPGGLQSLVEDAHGSVRVVTDCFFSRGLHSRSGPRDRHARRNKPAVAPVQDKEPMSSALPARFGHRAPSAGGFPGWRLTVATAAANAANAPGAAGYSSVPGMRGAGGGNGGAGGGAGVRRAHTGNGYGAPSPTGSSGAPWQQPQQPQQPGEAGEDEQGLGYGYGLASSQMGPVLELPLAGELPPGLGGAAAAAGGRSLPRSMTAGNRLQYT
ncbi:hypothetical protein HXX76_012629 [Chlamydomonas incerta]|uniref:Uncharacterized protein n=1 Tax=Chlamydomonas incerta TaxID=51695 RepID=A0A835SH72_CHLIN|nr:hypothetical protein HXX76_012629 [Chlamydomonas incerta]|eukprot:KAG2427118.1 hypothetical protein HXX76_012629 [Chlamydomonas incerta]